MYEHILIPVDLSEKSAHTVRAAAQLATPGRTAVTLLHVVETLDLPYEEMEDFYERLQEKAATTLARWVDVLAGEGHQAQQEICFGKRGREIVRYAGEAAVDLVVMRSHVVDPAHPGGALGTLSHQVALLVPCSVLLLREPAA
jgi:nucleotide-binding universal stress UspA family protein